MKFIWSNSFVEAWVLQPASNLLSSVKAQIRSPRPPTMFEYDDLIESLNKVRAKAGLPPVFDMRQAKQDRDLTRALDRAARRTVNPTMSTAPVGEGTYEYVPSDDAELDEPRGYRP